MVGAFKEPFSMGNRKIYTTKITILKVVRNVTHPEFVP